MNLRLGLLPLTLALLASGCFDHEMRPAHWEHITSMEGTNTCQSVAPNNFPVDHQTLQVNVTVQLTAGYVDFQLRDPQDAIVRTKTFTTSGVERYTIDSPASGDWRGTMSCSVPSPGVEWQILATGYTHPVG